MKANAVVFCGRGKMASIKSIRLTGKNCNQELLLNEYRQLQRPFVFILLIAGYAITKQLLNS